MMYLTIILDNPAKWLVASWTAWVPLPTDRDFSFLDHVETSSGVHPASCTDAI
jgi:hypothetical protein